MACRCSRARQTLQTPTKAAIDPFLLRRSNLRSNARTVVEKGHRQASRKPFFGTMQADCPFSSNAKSAIDYIAASARIYWAGGLKSLKIESKMLQSNFKSIFAGFEPHGNAPSSGRSRELIAARVVWQPLSGRSAKLSLPGAAESPPAGPSALRRPVAAPGAGPAPVGAPATPAR